MGECGICLEPFTDERGIRVPLVRACGHTHCRHCFTLLPHPAQCPTCRQVMSCEPQVNYALVAILASLDAQKADVSPEPSRTPAEPRAATSFLAAIDRSSAHRGGLHRQDGVRSGAYCHSRSSPAVMDRPHGSLLRRLPSLAALHRGRRELARGPRAGPRRRGRVVALICR